MANFPISIEDHLKEAGFNVTEILILRNVLTGKQYTLRELASKTGKSTGHLDQSMKKLLKRGIITKVIINNRTKYTLDSISALSKYIQKYFTDHVSTVKRRSQDVSAFFSTLRIEHSRPSMEYFDGDSGIKAFYERLQKELEPHEQLLSYMPVTPQIKEQFGQYIDQFTQFRRKQSIPLKVLTHNTLEARRYQSKDMLYNRETRFIEPDRCLLYIEHLLSNTAYCCIDYKNNAAQIIVYKEFVEEKRSIFMSLWNEAPLTMKEIAEGYTKNYSSSIAKQLQC